MKISHHPPQKQNVSLWAHVYFIKTNERLLHTAPRHEAAFLGILLVGYEL